MRFEITDKKKRDIFVHIFHYLKNFTDAIVMNIEQERLYIQGMDNSHICVYELILHSSWFETWDVNDTYTYGLSLPVLNKILHICSDKQTILIHSENDEDLEIDFTSDEKGEFNKYLKMPLMDITVDMLHIPDMEYDVDIEMDSKKFKSIIDELSNFNETLNLICDENQIVIESSSSEGSMKVVIEIDDIELLAIVEGKKLRASYGIKYIAQMSQFHKVSTNCLLHLTEEMPLQLKYVLDEQCMMRFYLAPKIDDN
jgi:proliferating cell nuclear antigen PCNA